MLPDGYQRVYDSEFNRERFVHKEVIADQQERFLPVWSEDGVRIYYCESESEAMCS
jgi:hypothetical protein